MNFKTLIFTAALTAFCSSLLADPFSADDQDFLEKNQRKAFQYFIKEADPVTGLVRDKAPNAEGASSTAAASIAASGFAVSAYAVGVERKWITRPEGMHRTRRALRFALNEVQHERGFFYHFISTKGGKRVMQSEVSPIDTALFIAGALFAAEYFQDPEISRLTKELYERIDFPWMQNGGTFFALSWSPEGKFGDRLWDHFDESLLLYVLGIGSPTHPIDAKPWHEMKRPVGSYGQYRMVTMPPLFTHQYPHIWLDFRDKHDGFMNYFDHSTTACKVSRQFSIDQSETYKTYGPSAWGLTASDGPQGYKAYGSPPGWATHDGTLAPTGCGGCMPFTPEESLTCLRHYKNQFKAMWGRYGLADAVNEDENWISPDVYAIDQGTIFLMIENARSELLWKTMMRIPAIQNAFEKIGFQPGSKELPWPAAPEAAAPYIHGGIQTDGYLKDWPGGIKPVILDEKTAEFGEFRKKNDGRAKVRFAWDEKALYFSAEVEDDSLVAKQNGNLIWRDDVFEIYVDPQGDGLYWENEHDFQIGFRPSANGEVTAWSWFQNGENPVQAGWAKAQCYSDSRGYVLEGALRWDALGIQPGPGMQILINPALHDVDADKSHRKTHWFFRSEEKLKRFALGRLTLEENHARKE